ncbi:MAG: type I-E CRISPR-associated endoribonuclease Cas2 [Firmicutes bacterium]|nr:type I-E CRISPR-associated endoribonuclease Cas2 [Bacillota bacterium]HQE02714.1 type I-E CRISPR-associated endoribonuclease Cas2e [Bacillota bacterium]
MVVITLTACPPALRGDLTRWLQEINTGVYVGRVSARVREKLWERIQESAKSGSATMVYSTNNEQHMDFRIHNTAWEPIDFDGLKLILRPSPARIKKLSEVRMGYSKAARRRKALQMTRKRSYLHPATYAIIDIETTGPSPAEHELRKISVIKIRNGEIQNRFSSQISSHSSIRDVLPEFLEFVGKTPIVSHNEEHIYGFLRAACARCGLPLFSNQCINILALARRLLDDVDNYRLDTLLEYFKIDASELEESMAIKLLYDKLIEFEKATK